MLVKTLSVAAGMLGLAAIGTLSTLHDARGGLDFAKAAPSGLAVMASGVQQAGVLQGAEGPFGLAAREPRPREDETAAAAASSEPRTERTADDATALGTGAAAEGPAPGSPASGNPAAPGSVTPGGQAPGLTPDGKVILNTASAADLDRLPGVGKKTAERIVELRTRLGRFKKLQDLLRVKGIGTKSLQKMLPMLVLDPPPS